MKARINELKSHPQGRAFLVAMLVFVGTLLTVIPVLAANPGIDNFTQCANGGSGTPAPWCPGTGTSWTAGNVNQIQAQYQPGQMVPQRLLFKGLSAGTVYSVTISWAAWENAPSGHAYDYIGTYSETVTTADPCDGFSAECTRSVGALTFPITQQPDLKAACGFGAENPVYPRTLVWTIWNGTIISQSPYVYSTSKSLSDNLGLTAAGCLVTTTDTFIGTTLTFTATSDAKDTVIAWGGHIASSSDWPLHAAPVISGANYHMYIVACGSPINGCGSQDNQVAIVPAPTSVRLSKLGVLEVNPAHATLQWTTASEVNTAGFNVYRAENPNGPFIRVNPQLISASSDSLLGGKYEYQDNTVLPGKTYYYQLEDVEYNGVSMRHPTVSVTMAAVAGLGNAGGVMMAFGLGMLTLAAAGIVILRKKSA